MKNIKKYYLAPLLFILCLSFFPAGFSLAEEGGMSAGAGEMMLEEYASEEMIQPEEAALPGKMAQQSGGEETFEAKVVRISEQKDIRREDGSTATQQNLVLKGLSGAWKGKQVEFEGISDIEVASAGVYEVGDRVLVQRAVDMEGNERFYVTDLVRRGYLYLLGLIFVLIILVIGRQKGLRSLIGLAASFIIIVKFILPKILAGNNPLLIGLIGAFFILMLMIYLTEGWGRKSHLSALSVLISLLATMALSSAFTKLARLSGMSEDASFLIGLSQTPINFQGLLLAGMLIGAIGVLDDVIISQIEAARQIKEANPCMGKRQVFQAAFAIGNTHLGTMVNTLFLTYAGASLPLLLLFVINQGAFASFGQVINNEVIATEIVRTLAGSIGVALSMPIATYFGAYWLKK